MRVFKLYKLKTFEFKNDEKIKIFTMVFNCNDYF